MDISTDLIQKLRQTTGVGIMDAKKALIESAGDFDKAVDVLKKKGQAVASKKQDRQTKEGLVGFYLHHNGKVAAMVALACESDFVAKTDDFKNLANDLAMHVAAMDPEYISPNDIPAEVIAKEKDIYTEQLKSEGKPENILENIIRGKLDKFYSEICLLKQPFVKDDQQKVEDLINEKIVKLGENIQIKDFKRMSL